MQNNKKLKVIKNSYISISFLVFLLYTTSCNVTKHIPDNQYLLTQYSLSIKDKSAKINKSEIESLVKQKPNHEIIGSFPLHLVIYNLVDPEKETQRRKERKAKVLRGEEKEDKFYLTAWIQEIGEKPVIWSKQKTKETDKQIIQYLKNKGFYEAKVIGVATFEKKKAEVVYQIEPGRPFRVDSISYKIKDKNIEKIILNNQKASLMKKNMLFDVDVLQRERTRIENHLKNHGYFAFSKEYIYFLADTSKARYKADITLGIKNMSRKRDSVIVEEPHKKYRIKTLSVYTNFEPQKMLKLQEEYISSFEKIVYDTAKIYFYGNQDFKIKPQTVLRENLIFPDSLYRQDDVKQTYQNLSSIQTFKLTNIRFSQQSAHDSLLDCHIQLTPNIRQSYIAQLEGSNASGNLGIAGSLTYRNRNLFSGGENFDFKIRGARETQSNVKEATKIELWNTNEIGLESNIHFPKFFFPFASEEFSKRHSLKTSFSLLYNYQDRPEYNRTITNLRFGYFWKSSKSPFFRYFINPIDLNAVHVSHISFLNSLNQYFLRYSYTNHLIIASNFTLIYDDQNFRKKRDHYYIRANYETAGNLLSLFNKLSKTSTDADGLYEIFGLNYAQYQKIDVDFRYYHHLMKNDQLVTRLFAGVAIPYGNSKKGLPFIKKYYSGGATGIRAWKVRSLGPGTYKPDSVFINNQTADLKLEANIEYRFKMFWVIEGALFVDAGNIWAINKYDQRKGALFKLKNLYNQIAVGSGMGLRLDFSFFIIRFDFGLKMRDPTAPLGKCWTILSEKFDKNMWTFNFGIGYPF